MFVARWKTQAAAAAAVMLVIGLSAPAADAQSIGVGPRMVLVSNAGTEGEVPAGSEQVRFTGAFLRLRASKHTSFEASFDYRAVDDSVLGQRVVSTPIQGTLLVYPVRTVIAPYVLGGIGWYRQKLEPAAGTSGAAITNSSFGYHAGFGGELMLGKRASIFLDYRYTFVNVDGAIDATDAATTALALFSPLGLLSLDGMPGIRRQGGMWTTGVTIYF